MHNEITLGLALIGAGVVAAYAVSPRATGLTEHVTLPRQAPIPSQQSPGAAASAGDPPVIISVPQRSPTQIAQVRGEEPQQIFPPPGDRAGLASALQRELQRVGCYDREINGVWTTSSRMAMQTFLSRVNAALPFDEPDLILLSLVQAHNGRACGRLCPGEKIRAVHNNARRTPCAARGSSQMKGRLTNSTLASPARCPPVPRRLQL